MSDGQGACKARGRQTREDSCPRWDGAGWREASSHAQNGTPFKTWTAYFWNFLWTLFGPQLTTGNWNCRNHNYRREGTTGPYELCDLGRGTWPYPSLTSLSLHWGLKYPPELLETFNERLEKQLAHNGYSVNGGYHSCHKAIKKSSMSKGQERRVTFFFDSLSSICYVQVPFYWNILLFFFLPFFFFHKTASLWTDTSYTLKIITSI